MSEEPQRPTLAACLIVRDEEERLPGALASVAFCDEIVVVDSGSRDATGAIARAAGARVVENPWPGFAAQRNVALDHATADWVLEVDADERVTPALEEAIRAFLADPPAGVDLAAMPRRDIFLGRRLFRAATYPGYRFRMLRRGAYRHDETRTVHEGLLPRGRVWALGGDLEHLLATNWREVVTDMVRYARLESRMVPRPVVGRAAAVGLLVRPAAKFAYRLVIGGGWRDGWRGAAWIARDCLSDALVWAFALTHPHEGQRVDEGERLRGHFGIVKPLEGPTRLVALARRAHAAERARGWLLRAGSAGADCALITDAPLAQTNDLRILRIFRFTPLRLIEALEAEHQLRPVDALVPVGWRERILYHFLPGHLRGRSEPLSLDDDPVRAATAAGAGSLSGPMKLVPEFEAGQLTAETPVPNWWPIRRRLEIAHEWARSPVLDVGGGTGWLALHLAEWGHDVTASDYSDEALANFEANLRITGREIPISKQDVAHLSYEDEQFASLFCISVLSYVADLDGALRELHRVLQPGGIAVIGCINAFGAFAFMFDRDPRTLFRKLRYRGDIRQDPEHFHGPRWWQQRFARHFIVRKVMPLEVLSPVIARFRGYDAPERWTRWDVRMAEHLPKELASEVIFVLQK